jgi:transposase-like protein
MTKRIEPDGIYRGRRFQTDTIEVCVRWYITYRLSYRDLAAMMAERGVVVSHTAIMRWVLRYMPEYERRWDRNARPMNSSWRMDEPAIRIRGRSTYLYRAVDKYGKSVDSVLRDPSRHRCRAGILSQRRRHSAGAVAMKGDARRNSASHRALRLPCDEDSRWKSVRVRSCRYLNNIVEQDHRAIKSRCRSMLGLIIPDGIDPSAWKRLRCKYAFVTHPG